MQKGAFPYDMLYYGFYTVIHRGELALTLDQFAESLVHHALHQRRNVLETVVKQISVYAAVRYYVFDRYLVEVGRSLSNLRKEASMAFF